MKNKKVLIIVVAAFVLLVGGALVLYGTLVGGAAQGQLLAMDGQQEPAEQQPPAGGEAPEQGEAGPEGAEQEQGAEGADAEQEQDAERVLAPDFTVYTRDGSAANLSDYVGKPIVLNFWASWCGPCKSEMPDFDQAYAELGDEVHFLMVNLTSGRETLRGAQEFIDENGYTFPVFYDTEADAAATYGIYSVPTTFFIDSRGFMVAQAMGAIDRATLQQGIDVVLPT